MSSCSSLTKPLGRSCTCHQVKRWGPLMMEELGLSGAGQVCISMNRMKSDRVTSVKVRRDSDNVEAFVEYDVHGRTSFDSAIVVTLGSTDAVCLGDFCAAPGYGDPDGLGAADSAWILEYYDNMGNGEHPHQSSFARQPKLVHNGVLRGGSGWASSWNGNTDNKGASENMADNAQPNTLVLVFREATSNLGGITRYVVDGDGAGARHLFAKYEPTDNWSIWAGGGWKDGPASDEVWHIALIVFNHASSKMYLDGKLTNISGNPGGHDFGGFCLHARYAWTQGGDSDIAFFMMLKGDQSALEPKIRNILERHFPFIDS